MNNQMKGKTSPTDRTMDAVRSRPNSSGTYYAAPLCRQRRAVAQARVSGGTVLAGLIGSGSCGHVLAGQPRRSRR